MTYLTCAIVGTAVAVLLTVACLSIALLVVALKLLEARGEALWWEQYADRLRRLIDGDQVAPANVIDFAAARAARRGRDHSGDAA